MVKPPDKNVIALCGKMEFISPVQGYTGWMEVRGNKQILKRILEPENKYKS